jgi:hypothetical protein
MLVPSLASDGSYAIPLSQKYSQESAVKQVNNRLRDLRVRMSSQDAPGHSMSRPELAAAVNGWIAARRGRECALDANYIGKLERGVIRWPQKDYRAALRAILGVVTDGDLGFYPPKRHSGGDLQEGDGHVRMLSGVSEPAPRAQSQILNGTVPGGASDAEGEHSPQQSAPSPQESSETADHGSSLNQPVTVEGMKRRTAMALPIVATASLISDPNEPWQRLVHALKNPRQLDALSMESLEFRTLEFFRREEYTPSRELVADLDNHVADLKRLLQGAGGNFALRLEVTLGEALTLAAWLAFDCKQLRRSGYLLRQAQYAASQANDGPLQSCALAYRSYMAEAEGNTSAARELLAQAQMNTRGEHSAATRSWLAAREAEVDATEGDALAALRALDRAMTAYDYAHPHQERPWTGFFTPTRLGSMAITTYSRLRHDELDATAESVVASLPTTDAKIKAVILADIAIAALQCGQLDQAAQFGGDALDATLAHEASLGRQRLSDLHRMILEKGTTLELADLDGRLVAEGL